MGVNPEQAGKLAEAAAERVLAHLEGERLISRFIDSYVMGFDRPQLKNPADEFLARSNQLARQALLLLAVLVEEKCSAKFLRVRLGPLKLRDAGAARGFSEAFWPALAARLRTGAESPAEFSSEAGDYRNAAGRAGRFAQRVAPLLDPLPRMQEKAEHAGQKFFEALDKVSDQVVTRVLA